MRLFSFDPEDHKDDFAKKGWVHIRGGLSPEFLSFARNVIADARAQEALAGRGIAGAKEQFVFDFPEPAHYEEMFSTVSALCGLRSDLTLSERHVKIYEKDADPDPTAHKDRFASQVSMGLSVAVPGDSYLVLYPETDYWVNPFLGTALRDSLEPDQAPDVVLAGAPEVRIEDRPGDVIVFHGSATWHLRRNSAETVNIYLKFNEFGSDPLGEDPSTPVRREATLALASLGDDALGPVVPELSRRFDSISREYRREGWPERLFANVWGQNPFPLSDEEERLLRAVGGGVTVSDLVADGHSPAAVRRLASRGAIDLLSTAGR